jgi:hypothetical protein
LEWRKHGYNIRFTKKKTAVYIPEPNLFSVLVARGRLFPGAVPCGKPGVCRISTLGFVPHLTSDAAPHTDRSVSPLDRWLDLRLGLSEGGLLGPRAYFDAQTTAIAVHKSVTLPPNN